MIDSINLNILNIASIIPMLVLIGFGIFLLGISIFSRGLSRQFYTAFCILAIALDVGFILGFSNQSSGFFGLIFIDGISILSILIISIASIFFLPFSLSKNDFFEYNIPEFFALFLIMLAGYEFMVSSKNLILIFIGLEISSLALYTLIALHNNKSSVQAAIKYFSMGAVSSGFFAFSMALFYMLTNSFEINEIVLNASKSNLQGNILLLTAFIFMVVAVGFKLSLIPFHAWVSEVYSGASSAMAGFISVVPKVGILVIVIRFFEGFVKFDFVWIENFVLILSILTMCVANILALVQNDIKKMLAYSSIFHTGFVLSALAAGSLQVNIGIFYYWIMFAFANLGAFAFLWSRSTNLVMSYDKFSGLVKQNPTLATIGALFMLSLAGIPPFSVFWGKAYLMSSVINAGYFWLAIVMAVNSAVAVYYYLKLVVYMFLKDSMGDGVYFANLSNPMKFILAFASLGSLFAIFMSQNLLQAIKWYVSGVIF